MRQQGWLFRILWLVVCGIVALGSQALAQGQRDISVMPKVQAGSVPITGQYWAIIIGIDEYQHAPNLHSAVKDATAVRDVLTARYGFEPARITTLLNEEATGPKIQNALYHMGKQAGKDDSVFIYYAGHGQYDESGRLGWWVPTEANPKNPGTFIMDVAILNYIKGMQAKHVYLVADSCFSGTLFGTRALPPITDRWFAELYAESSRWALTSGANEPVADQGKNGHSPFAYFFLKTLRQNTAPYLVPSHIYDRVGPLVSNNTLQTPRSEPLKQAGDEGGQFVFRLATTPRVTDAGSDYLQTQRQRLEADRTQFEAEREAFRQQAEERARLNAERQKLMEEQQQFAKEQAQLMAKAPAYATPQRLGKNITGKDGAAMMLVPAGAFTMGSHDYEQPPHKVELDAFYLDKFEVTTARYRNFMNATQRKAPDYWTDTIPVSQGQKPVVGVSWHDAEAYCTHYGKRLPSEAEWEKAARGTDEREYPWGNEDPTASHANFGHYCCDLQNYRVLTNVGSKPAGVSPYGIHDMAGNVWEWVADWYAGDYYQRSPVKNPSGPSSGQKKVRRGGSWLTPSFIVRSAFRYGNSTSFRNDDVGFRCAQDAP